MPIFLEEGYRSKRTVVLHIGGEKTGTTTLQNFLYTNSDLLSRHGIYYPGGSEHSYFEGAGHFPVAAALLPDNSFIDFVSTEKTSVLSDVFAELTHDISAISHGVVIISAEHLSSRVFDIAAINQLREHLYACSDDVWVVYYARDQASLALSSYSTSLKSGGFDRFCSDKVSPSDTYFNHYDLLERWAAVFGEDRIVAVEYDPSRFPMGDICVDFFDQIGLEIPAGVRTLENQNIALDDVASEVVRLINRKLHEIGISDQSYWLINKIRNEVVVPAVSAGFGRKISLTHNDRLRIMGMFLSSNRLLNSKYLNNTLSSFWLDNEYSSVEPAECVDCFRLDADRLLECFSTVCAALMVELLRRGVSKDLDQERSSLVSFLDLGEA